METETTFLCTEPMEPEPRLCVYAQKVPFTLEEHMEELKKRLGAFTRMLKIGVEGTNDLVQEGVAAEAASLLAYFSSVEVVKVIRHMNADSKFLEENTQVCDILSDLLTSTVMFTDSVLF